MRRQDVRSIAMAALVTAGLLAPSGLTATGALVPAHAVAAVTTPAQLPQGGTQILGRYRVVAFYGGVRGPALGVLGSQPPEQIAGRIEARAASWRRFGLPVQPAMELIVTVAQGAPGADGSYSEPIDRAALVPYLRAAHRHRMLLVLDFQPGRAEFLDQVKLFRYALLDPWVSVALDPEWKMGPTEVPARVIGHAYAYEVNDVRRYLSRIVVAAHLPDKLLVVHQFTTGMLPDRENIRPGPGVEVVFHADGFGSPAAKIATWRRMAFPARPFGTGFKLFLRQDSPMMTAEQVMGRRPRPDLITYQ